MAKKNNEDFSEFLDLEKEVLDNNEYSDFLNLEKEVESKKKSQSQSGSSTEESSSGTSATKKEQSSGTTKPLSLEEKKALAVQQKLKQLGEKKQESVTALEKKQGATSLDKSKQDSKLALDRKQKLTNINWEVDKETEQAFKGISSERKDKAIQEAMSVGESYVPNIEIKARAKEIQEAKPEQDLQRRLNLIPKEDLKSIFEGDNELTMFDGGQRLAEKYKLTEEEVDKAKAKYLDETVKEFKRKDLESSLDLINKYAPAPKDFKDITAYTQNMELLNKAKEMNFEKNKNLSFSLMGLEDNDRKVVDEYSSVMDRLNAYKSKSFMQQQQGADETGKGSMVINPKEIAQFEKDLKESQRLSKEIDKIRGNNNKLFDQYANVINKETGKEVTQESFTSKYENDYMKLKGALTDATYKLNYVEKEARRIRDTAQKAARGQTPKENEALSNLDRERNLAKAEVLALSNALFLNEDITRKVARYEKADSYYQMPGKKAERLFEVLSDLKQGFSETVLGEFNMTSTSEKNQARILNEKLKEVGINLKDIDKEIAPTFPEKMGNVLGTSAVLGANIAVTSFLTGGAGTLARGAGLLPKVFAMYDKGGKFSKIANMVISGVNFELASDDTSFAMGAAEEGAQIVFEKVFSKLKPLSPLVNFLTKSLTGAIGVTGEEYFGDLAEQFTKTGISQETLDATFGKTKEEGLEKFALTFTMGMMSVGKHAKILMVGSYEVAKAKNPNSTTVKQMEEVMSEMGVDPDDVIAQLKAEAQTKSDRLYPDGKGGQLSASNMTVEQEIVLRDKLKYKPLTEEELDIKRTVQEQEELAPADSPYVTKKEMDDDLKVLKGEDEGTLPETYVGESVRTEEGIVTTVTEKVEEGTQLRVPTEQLVVEEAKPVAETFDRKKAGVIDVWQDTETNELFVINGTKRVATAMEDGVASVDVNFVKANSLQEAYKIGDLKNKLEDTDKTIDAVELVKANPTLKENLDLSKPKEAELYGLSSLNESLTEELKSNPNQAGVLSIIGNNVSTEKQSEVYQFAKDNNLGKDEVAQLVKEPNLLEKIKTKGVTEEKVSVQPKNIKDLYNVNRRLFGLDKLKSLSSAVVMDRMIGVMAKRAKITKEQMYGRLKFEKASEELFKNLSPKGKLLYQIVGENAQLGQNVRDNLQVARDMEASGNDAKTIRIATGWEKGKDGKWRYELGDTIFDLNDKSKLSIRKLLKTSNSPGDGIKLSDLGLRVEGYPNLSDITIELRENTPYSRMSGATAFYDNSTKKIVLSASVFKKTLKEVEFNLNRSGAFGEAYVKNDKQLHNEWLEFNSTLLHEIQHAIQHIEGFAKGTNPGLQTLVSSAIPFSEIIKFEKSNKEYSDLVEKDEKGILSDEERDKMESMFEKFRKEYFEQNKPETGFERYRKTAGEVEARNVQTRMGMTSAQRRETTLEETEDVARDEQTVLFQKTQNKAQGAAMVANDGKAIIYALTDPNVSTPLHELAHVYEHYLTDAERKTIQEFAGTTEWTTETSEVFARGFEKYLAEGVAPNSVLQKVFEKFKEWLIDIYNGIKGSDIDIELNKPMRDIYAQMVGADNSLIKAEVEIKTELSKTGQSNIDALSEDATQLGLEPETLYDRVLSNSPTVKALTEKYAKGVASGLYSTTEATNRLNAEIKENLDVIKKEAGLDEAKKEVAQLESALTSDKKTSSDVLRDIASKIDKIADKMSNNTYSTIFGVEPLIAKAFLKILSASLKTSANFIDGFNKAIVEFKNSDILKGKTAQEINDIVAQLTKATTDIKQIADLKNPITKLQQSKVKQNVRDRIKHLYKTQMTSLPTLASIEKIANKYGIIDAKTFAEKLYKDLDGLEKTRAKRMETFEGAVSDFITKGGGNIKSLFNQLSDLILKDKQQATILRNIFLNAMSGVTTKGVKFTTSQVSSITNAFQKANLNNLSGIYDLTQQIEQIVTKAVDFKVNEDINSLQKAIKKFKNIPKKQLMVFQTLANIEANHLTATTKTELLNALEDIKSYLSGSSNLSYNENQLNSIIKKAETESENYTNDKRKALIQKRYKEYKKNNPKTTLSEKEYENMIMLTEEQRAKERGVEKRGIKRDEKRADLEKLTEENIEELFNYKIGSSTSSAGKTVLEVDTFNKILIPALRKLIDTGELKNLSDIQLKEINQLHSELMNFDSLAKLGFVANQMSGVLKANENKQLIKDSFREFSNVIKSVLTPNKGKYQGLTLGQAFKRIFVGSTGQKISAEIISKVNVGINLAKTEYKKFNKNFEEALKFEVSSSENYDLGAKAYFLTSPKGLSDIDAQLLFENKKEKLQRDIDELRRISESKDSSRNKKKSAEIRANQYQESLDFINKFDTYEDYVNAYNNGEVFSEKQQRVFDLAKNEYEKQKPMLIASNILFNGNAFIEEDYYTSTSYLKNEVGAKADKSVTDEAFNNLNVIRDPQSGTVFKKVNPASVGTDKILDFDFTGVTQSRVLENYYDMFTRGSVIELDALLQAESFYENFKDKNMTETYSYLYQRIANWINNETSVQQSKLDNSRSLSKKTTDVLSNIKKAILNTTGQVVKQPTVLFHTLSRFGAKDFTQGLAFYANNLASEKGRDKIRQLLDGSDVRNRAPLGDEQIAQSLNRQKSFALTDSGTYRFLQKLYSEPLRMIPGLKDSKVASAISLQKALNIGDAAMVYSDIMAAQLTYITAMINQQKKEGYDVKSIDDLIFNKNEKNTHIADMLSAEINNESATSKQGNLFSGKDNKILANLFFMFQSHASNASHAASNALLDMFETNKNVTVEDRFNGVKAIVGFTSAIITFRAMSEIVKLLYAQIYETAADEIGYEDPRDDEEKDRLKLLKDKQFLEEASYRIGINAFTDIFFGGKFPSLVKDLTVLGTNTLFENLHLKYVDEEYEGRLPYSSNPMEYSGVVGAGTDFISDAYKVMSPPLDNVERDDILREMALETLIRQQYESYKNDKQGAFIDGLYTMFKLSGKGEPAKMMQMLQKQRERGFKEEDKKRTGVLNLLFEKRK